MKTALIIGYRGQDGCLLTEYLLTQGYKVIGIGRSDWAENGVVMGIRPDINDITFVRRLLIEKQPHEIYYLAAHHTSSEKQAISSSLMDSFNLSQAVHVTGLLNFLIAMVELLPYSRLFYAASSLVFSGRYGEMQNESTPFDPIGMYGITKAQGIWLCREFRNKHGIFVSCGILYNHESRFRPPGFLTAKIIRAAIDIAKGDKTNLEIGNVKAKVDWGYAPDYVKAFHAILLLDQADDFVMATGEAHSVEELLSHVFDIFSLDWQQHVTVNPDLLFRIQPVKRGNPAKLLDHTGISLSRPFEEFVRRLVLDHWLVETRNMTPWFSGLQE